MLLRRHPEGQRGISLVPGTTLLVTAEPVLEENSGKQMTVLGQRKSQLMARGAGGANPVRTADRKDSS